MISLCRAPELRVITTPLSARPPPINDKHSALQQPQSTPYSNANTFNGSTTVNTLVMTSIDTVRRVATDQRREPTAVATNNADAAIVDTHETVLTISPFMTVSSTLRSPSSTNKHSA